MAVIGGRERPRWDEAPRFTIPAEYLHIQLVGDISQPDGLDYLTKAGITNSVLQKTLLDYAEVTPNQYHPLSLGLGVDVVEAALRQGITLTAENFSLAPQVTNKQKELINRLLRYVDAQISYAVRTLSACRIFNRQIYFTLGKALHFHATQPSFDILTQFSFVWPDQRHSEGSYRIHDLLRQLLREHEQTVLHEADNVLENYYRQQAQASQEIAIAEAIYTSLRNCARERADSSEED